MDFQNIIYIIGGAIYLLYYANKGLKEHKDNRPKKSKPVAKKGWQEDLQDMLKNVLDVDVEANPKHKVKPNPAAQAVKREAPVHNHADDFLDKEREEYLRNKKQDELLHQREEAYSVEYDDRPLKDHVTMADIQREPDEISVGAKMIYDEGFDARKAFLYGEIFNRRGGRS